MGLVKRTCYFVRERYRNGRRWEAGVTRQVLSAERAIEAASKQPGAVAYVAFGDPALEIWDEVALLGRRGADEPLA